MRTHPDSRRRSKARGVGYLACALAVLAFTSAQAAQNEAVSYGVDNHSTGSACFIGDTTMDLSYCVAKAEAFDDAFDDWVGDGKWTTSVLYRNTAVDDRDWTDAAEESWGADDNDPYGADHADVAFLCTHGKSTAVRPFYYTTFYMGDGDNYICDVESDRHMRLGQGGADSDMEIAVLFPCQSAQYYVWNNGGFDEVQNGGSAFNTWLGFHGLSIDSRRDLNHFENFVNSSYSTGLGDNWLDMLYRSSVSVDDERFDSSSVDECPAAVIWAASDTKCDSVFDYGGFGDRDNEGSSHGTTCYYFIEGCDPSHGGPLYD